MIYNASKSLVCGMLVVSAALLFTGCGDTAGARTVEQPTKAQINQQIADLKANTRVPDSFKQDALKKLQDQLASAR